MNRKLLAPLVLMAAFAMTGMVSANLLTNGDFTLDDGVVSHNALGWNEDNSAWPGDMNAWVNRETAANGPYGDTNNFHYALGYYGGYGAIVWQDVTVADDQSWYGLSADNSLDAWWLNSGYLKIEFYDASGTTMLGSAESAHWSQPTYDVGTPWAKYSVYGQAPAGTEMVRSILGTYGEGGTARFDNADLQVVPEPATIGLVGLFGGGLLFLRRRSRI